MTLSSLLERLEKAEGASRELDVAVAEASGWQRRESAHGVYWIAPHGEFDVVPPYTSSIDAALTLVPDTYEWEIGGGNPNFDNPAWCDICPREQPYLAELEFFAEGVNSAIAICIAAIRQLPTTERGE